VLHARVSLEIQDAKKSPTIRHLGTIAQLTSYIFATKARIDNRKKLVKHICSFCWRAWGTPANFNGFRVLAALLHATLLVDVSQTLRRSTEGATYIRQGGHHVGHWPRF